MASSWSECDDPRGAASTVICRRSAFSVAAIAQVLVVIPQLGPPPGSCCRAAAGPEFSVVRLRLEH
jgi:hypothetical protein